MTMLEGATIAQETSRSCPDWFRERTREPMPSGAVLVHAAASTLQSPGGGEVQLLQTARALETLGVPVRPFVSWTDRIADARLLHLFGMSPEGLALARVAKSRGVPVVLSPICWFEPRAWAAESRTAWGRAGVWAKWLGWRLSRGRGSWRAELLSQADAILPNSEAEKRQLLALFRLDPDRVHVIPNGVDPRFLRPDPEAARDLLGPGDFALYVGRIEPRKNVLGLIRAMRPMGLPLVVAGDPVPGHEGYAAVCREVGETSVRWIPRLDHDDPRLASLYAAARVFALVSWFETPGLAALEAAAAGAAVVITPNGSTREYFGELAHYARPGRRKETQLALVAAWARGPQPDLSRRVRNGYLWAHVARRTAEVYHALDR
jgi:glycosyltransferase involved in cell wall biosynthesis